MLDLIWTFYISQSCRPSYDFLTLWAFGNVAEILNVWFSKHISGINILCISIWLDRKWMSQDHTDDKSTSVHVMAWCSQATSYYLRQCWPRSMSHMVLLGHNELIQEYVPEICHQFLSDHANLLKIFSHNYNTSLCSMWFNWLPPGRFE